MELSIINLFCGMGGDELGIRDAVYTDLVPVRTARAPVRTLLERHAK